MCVCGGGVGGFLGGIERVALKDVDGKRGQIKEDPDKDGSVL